ncbi:hypothetical protein BJX63DRAFT_58297 [Aspergillus granulosus]|uniref:BZIP domain-containing protein n=1 Tax=Aspergillus granulosus TaxID=176169 RepID=A0ABR4HT87_9EURO
MTQGKQPKTSSSRADIARETKRERDARAQARFRSRRKAEMIAQEQELKAYEEKRSQLAAELAERTRERIMLEKKLRWIRDIDNQITPMIEDLQKRASDLAMENHALRLQVELQVGLRVAPCSGTQDNNNAQAYYMQSGASQVL